MVLAVVQVPLLYSAGTVAGISAPDSLAAPSYPAYPFAISLCAVNSDCSSHPYGELYNTIISAAANTLFHNDVAPILVLFGSLSCFPSVRIPIRNVLVLAIVPVSVSAITVKALDTP